MKEHKVVGVFRQILILLWKNKILFKRNTWGTLAEILVAFIFVLILLVLRYFVDSTRLVAQDSNSVQATSILRSTSLTTNRSLIMYFPNNSLAQAIVTNAYNLMKSQRPTFNATGKIKYMNCTIV